MKNLSAEPDIVIKIKLKLCFSQNTYIILLIGIYKRWCRYRKTLKNYILYKKKYNFYISKGV